MLEAGPAVVFDLDGVLSDAAAASTISSARTGTGTPSSRPAATTRCIDEVARLLELLDPSSPIVLLTARPIRVQPQTLGWLERYELRWDLLVMRDFGDYCRGPTFKRRSVASSAPYGFDLRLAFEDDRAQPGDVPRRGRPLRLHPLRLLRLSPRATNRPQSFRGDEDPSVDASGVVRAGTYSWVTDAVKTVVQLAH